MLLLLITGCGAKQEAKRPLPLVQVAEIGQASFSPGIDVVSQLESVTDVVLKPETNGKVVKILVKQGEKVRQGQVLLVLDNVQPARRLDASIAEARKDKLNAERYTFLANQGAVSRKEQDFYVTQAIESRDRARAARATLGYSYLRAPFDGEIGDLSSVKIGDYVKTGQAITGIVSNSLLWTNMDVPAAVANQVQTGAAGVVDHPGQSTLPGGRQSGVHLPLFPRRFRLRQQFPQHGAGESGIPQSHRQAQTRPEGEEPDHHPAKRINLRCRCRRC